MCVLANVKKKKIHLMELLVWRLVFVSSFRYGIRLHHVQWLCLDRGDSISLSLVAYTLQCYRSGKKKKIMMKKEGGGEAGRGAN